MKKCHVVYLVCTAAMIGTGLGAAPASAGHMIHVVHPGESIQKAVDAAESGDTVLVTPGTYRESVKVSTPGLTLRGMGRNTVIKPGTVKATADNTCAEGGNGICVIGTKDENVKGVTVADLTVTGFTRTGVFSMATDGLTVRNVTAVKNGVWGIAQERSIHGTFRDNTARDNGDAGIFLANSIKAEEGAADTEGTEVAHNRLEGNRIGVTVRRLRNLAVADNHITGNCAGVFVVGDENKPKAGDLVVRDNRVVRNNKSCPKTDRLEALQGSGIVLTGVEKVLVADNTVEGNAGKSSMSGGIVLAASMVGTPNASNEVNGNRLRDNSPADLVNAGTGDTAKSNTFTGNTCGASKPAGLC
ncbi:MULTISPECIES: right-handed parallel beta-helix repeat-containing protein [Streptomyces]|uniref:Right-handed parallel beta-helix repeat-containing protein n=1 Tax=Streptomyces rochei TaxID=1928 RepID=A0AAX3ZE60_STRRO|nr:MULTISPECIES: right-handed parallel beta-helix repeat-containing protein [Streptomyces]WDI16631.1 right-handed parallel beta-helix repeat-containing protein [Streptomyces enissocaesilis]WMC84632.1 right-handed parallel beta-helix repeat-containing protein [Streptomyces rochei]WQC11013.1 right-handed parallel beta-helix repeat-containing protein [Streptomyces rochei]